MNNFKKGVVFVYSNRRMIGLALGSILVFFGHSDEAALIREIGNLK